MMSRMHERYRKEVIPALMKRFGRTNPMSVPRVAKVTVNIGMGEASQNVQLLDGPGNYTSGLRDQLVFPEIDYTRVDKIKGLNITLTTTAKNDEEGRELLKLLGVPMRAQGDTGRNWRRNDGARFAICQDAQETEVQGTRAQPLPPVRPPARVPAKISNVPHLFSRT